MQDVRKQPKFLKGNNLIVGENTCSRERAFCYVEKHQTSTFYFDCLSLSSIIH